MGHDTERQQELITEYEVGDHLIRRHRFGLGDTVDAAWLRREHKLRHRSGGAEGHFHRWIDGVAPRLATDHSHFGHDIEHLRQVYTETELVRHIEADHLNLERMDPNWRSNPWIAHAADHNAGHISYEHWDDKQCTVENISKTARCPNDAAFKVNVSQTGDVTSIQQAPYAAGAGICAECLVPVLRALKPSQIATLVTL